MVYQFQMLCETSKVPFGISHRTLNPYTAQYVSYWYFFFEWCTIRFNYDVISLSETGPCKVILMNTGQSELHQSTTIDNNLQTVSIIFGQYWTVLKYIIFPWTICRNHRSTFVLICHVTNACLLLGLSLVGWRHGERFDHISKGISYWRNWNACYGIGQYCIKQTRKCDPFSRHCSYFIHHSYILNRTALDLVRKTRLQARMIEYAMKGWHVITRASDINYGLILDNFAPSNRLIERKLIFITAIYWQEHDLVVSSIVLILVIIFFPQY